MFDPIHETSRRNTNDSRLTLVRAKVGLKINRQGGCNRYSEIVGDNELAKCQRHAASVIASATQGRGRAWQGRAGQGISCPPAASRPPRPPRPPFPVSNTCWVCLSSGPPRPRSACTAAMITLLITVFYYLALKTPMLPHLDICSNQ
jgi:hypothetical protein